MAIPVEFTPEVFNASKDDAFTPYRRFLGSGEPYRSLMKNNPWMKVPGPDDVLEWDKGWYYDTTVGRKHPYWHDQLLPTPTKDIGRLRHDLFEWGYCLIEDGLSDAQVEVIHKRVAEQAAAERALGVAHVSPAQQHVWALVNKGDVFLRCMEMDPDAIQSGPLIERLHDETLGAGWNHLSFISNISFPGCHPQGLHQDQSFIAPYLPLEAPVLVNTVYILQDVNEHNGGTLLIPGSHRPNGRDGECYGELPPPINLEAPRGAVMLMDGRVFHGGAVNRSDRLRYIITNSVVKPWIRQQENFALTMSPEVLAKASDKLLMRTGMLATSTRGMVEGYGYSGSGRTGDPNGSIVHVRKLMDQNDYRRLPALTPADVAEQPPSTFGLSRIKEAHETWRSGRFNKLLAQVQDRVQEPDRVD